MFGAYFNAPTKHKSQGAQESVLQRTITSQIASSLVTLLGTEKEIQFVTLETIYSMLPRYADEFQRHLQVNVF